MSSNQQTLSFVGSVIGSYFGGPVGAAAGSYIGSYIGASFDELPDVYSPRLEDRKIQTSAYGVPIPLAYGTVRIAGNMNWMLGNALTEVASTDETGGKSGQPAQSTTIYSYYATFSLLLSATPSRSVRRIWAGGMLLYDGGLINSVTPNFGLTFYRGSADQLPDPLIEAEKGVGNTPAFRGKSYLVFDAMPVEKTGWPVNFTVELVGEGTFAYSDEALGVPDSNGWDASIQRLDGNIIGHQRLSPTSLRLSVLDQQTGAVLLSADHALASDDVTALYDSNFCYVPPLDEAWLAGGAGVLRFNASTLEYLGEIYNFGGSSRMAWDPVRQRVFHRPNAYWLAAGGQNVLIAGAGSVADVISAERCGYIGLDYVVGFEAMDAILGSVSLGSATHKVSAANDPMRRRYIVFGTDDLAHSVTDSTSPVIASIATGSFTDSINRAVLYDASTDCFLKFGVLVGLVQITAFDAESMDVVFHRDEISEIDRLGLGVTAAFTDTTATGRVFVVGDGQPWAFNYFGSTLAACVTDLCDRSGLEAADIDVSELTQDLRGYLISAVDSARPAIEQLAKVFSFNGCEEDDQVVFKMRGSASVATIARDECGAMDGSSQPDEPSPAITAVRAQQLDLPKFCTVTAPDPERDFEPNTQQSQRQAATAGKVMQFSTAVTLSADEQIRLANLMMYDAWTSRTGLKFSTDARHTRAMPGDVATLDGRRVLLLTKQSGGATIDWEAVSDDASVLTQYGTGINGDYPHQVPPQTVPTYQVMLDVPLLSDAEDTPGAYIAAWGIDPHWRGGVVYQSIDGGVSWSRMATFPRPGVSIGDAVNALGNFSGGNVFDEGNTLTVRMRNGTPSSMTRDAVLAGGNGVAVRSTADSDNSGWEILQFRTATLNGDGSYTLSGLLRGRLGTDWAMAGHAAGDDVVLLETAQLRDFAIEASEIGVPTLTKAVSIGSTLSDTDSESVTINAERLEPLSPVDLRIARDPATNDATLTWRRRSRLSYRFLAAGISAPLGEDSESYEIDILSGVTVVRTITAATNSAAYSAANQTADGLTPGDPITANVYMVSATVGRGHVLEATA
jgi:hypothetical protein